MKTEQDLLTLINFRVGDHYYKTLKEAKRAAREDARLSAKEGQNACRQVIEVVTDQVVCRYLSVKGARKHKVVMRTPPATPPATPPTPPPQEEEEDENENPYGLPCPRSCPCRGLVFLGCW